MAKQKTQGKGCLVIAISLLLIMALVTACVVVVLNLTPNQIGLADISLVEGKSANQLGMGDSKIKELVQYILDKISNKNTA